MARPKKNGTYLNVCIETPIYERLENFCKDAGHTKTVAVERALISYFDEYEEMKKKRFFVSVIAILLIIVMVGTMVAGYLMM